MNTSEPSDFFIDTAFTLAALGFWLFLGVAFCAAATRFRTGARYLLRYGSIAGAFTAAAMALFFMLDEAIALPGPGNLAVIAAMFFAGFSAAVPVLLVWRWIKY